ncbi:hypothetical protein C8R44DRAFT_894914 [Mycena epipterygia]|nr:hypothetical protein C8R44DRAFT_894914 [Mycena epipterygia]
MHPSLAFSSCASRPRILILAIRYSPRTVYWAPTERLFVAHTGFWHLAFQPFEKRYGDAGTFTAAFPEQPRVLGRTCIVRCALIHFLFGIGKFWIFVFGDEFIGTGICLRHGAWSLYESRYVIPDERRASPGKPVRARTITAGAYRALIFRLLGLPHVALHTSHILSADEVIVPAAFLGYPSVR